MLINASYGLGENVVQGSVNPDEYYVFKPTLKHGLQADPAEDASARKEFKLVYDEGGSRDVKNVPGRRRAIAHVRASTTMRS